MKFLQKRGLTWSGLIRLVLSNIREGGFQVTLRKAFAHLVQTDGGFNVGLYTRWFSRHGLQAAAPAVELFAGERVVIIGALDIPQCRKYRVMQKVEYLNDCGIPCAYEDYRELNRAFSLLQLASVVVFYRLPNSEEGDALVAEAERLGLRAYYDIDDPIFDRACYAANRNLETLSQRERDALLAQVPDYAAIMRRVGRLIVSTSAMQELARRSLAADNVAVWPNLVDGAMLSVCEQLPPPAPRDDDSLWLGYFSGSRAHDRDFESIAAVLAELLQRHPRLRLLVGGFAQLPAVLRERGDSIRVAGHLSYPAYLENLRRVDVNLVPLLRDEFNACKSAIRFLEASLCGVPTVAADVGQFSELIRQGETGYLCADEVAWRDTLEHLIGDPEQRRRVGAAAREQVLETQRLDAAAQAGLLSVLGIRRAA